MKPLVLLHPLPLSISSFSTLQSSSQFKSYFRNPLFCTSLRSQSIKVDDAASISEYKPGFLDDLFLNFFRNKMVEEVGWNSETPGYDGLIEVANRLMTKGRKNSDAVDASVRVLKSLFPPLLLELYRILVAPLAEGKVAAIMVARVTALTCQWLMGTCKVNLIDLPDGSSCESGVFVEKCKYLEESKCIGICINTCKLPTQTFFHQHMGVPLLMEPNFKDYSCQFKFGILSPQPEDDSAIREPCLEICPTASRRREITPSTQPLQCPKWWTKWGMYDYSKLRLIYRYGVINDGTDQKGMYDYFATHALISDQTNLRIQKLCDFSPNATSQSLECVSATREADKDTGSLDIYNIYAPLRFSSNLTSKPKKAFIWRYDPCTDYYVYAYLNSPNVQKAIHANVTKFTHDWEPCSDVISTWKDSPSTIIPLLREFMANNLRVWVFSGDTDGRVPVTSTKYSIDAMKLPVKTAWYPWFLRGEIGGYTQVYEGGLTFSTVRGAGHQVPSYQPGRALSLISHFLRGTPLPEVFSD